MKTPVISFLALASLTGLASATASGQTPQTYSLTVKVAGGMTVEVARDGSRESVEQIVPPSNMGPGMHLRSIYDFAAHKVWTLNLEGGPCTVVAYTSPAAPSMFDPFAGIEEIRAGLAEYTPAAVKTETVNGIATNVYEMPVPEIGGTSRLFLDQKYRFPVKMVVVSEGKEQTQMEIVRVSYAKPAANLLVPPTGCQVLAGETNATGGHADMTVSQQAQGETKLGDAAPRSSEIDIRGAGVSPQHYTGPAPAAFTFSFSIDAPGPVQAEWVLVLGENAVESGKLAFDKAGTKELTVRAKIGTSNGVPWEGAVHLEVVVAEKRFSSPPLQISADCKAK